MDLRKLTKLLGKPIIINRMQVFTDSADITECIQGILKEIKSHSIRIEQCFTDGDYIDKKTSCTVRELTDEEFVLVAPLRNVRGTN